LIRRRRRAAGPFVLVLLAGCATAPPPAAEPVAAPPAQSIQAKIEPTPVIPVPVPPLVIVQSPPETQVIAAPVNEEEQQALALLTDLQRYAAESGDDLRRELASMNQAVTRTRSDANRIRLAMLLTLPAAGPPDDARALALLDSVPGKGPGGASSPLKQIAVVLSAQISERTRSVREEQKKTAAAQEKLDALRAVERSLLLERSRNAGGGAGGGGGGGTGR
jgi:hypothetical protein